MFSLLNTCTQIFWIVKYLTHELQFHLVDPTIESKVTKIIIYMPLNRNFSVSTVQYMLKDILSVS